MVVLVAEASPNPHLSLIDCLGTMLVLMLGTDGAESAA
jgi:hypothetical protein